MTVVMVVVVRVCLKQRHNCLHFLAWYQPAVVLEFSRAPRPQGLKQLQQASQLEPGVVSKSGELRCQGG